MDGNREGGDGSFIKEWDLETGNSSNREKGSGLQVGFHDKV